MKNSLYTHTVPVYTRGLRNLLSLLEKAEKSARVRKFDVEVLVQARLAPDQFSLQKQVQYAYFVALDVVSKLSGKAMPHFTYKEKTVADLKKSVRRSLAYLQKIKSEDYERARKSTVAAFWDAKDVRSARLYVDQASTPMFYFHVVTAYAILRHNGVPLGMDDYLGEA